VASSSDVPMTDLRDYLTRKRSVHQITSQCHCERLISAVFTYCHCDFQITKASIFRQLLAASNSVKRRQCRKKKLFSDIEYPEVTVNMVGSSSTPSKFKGKQLAVSSEETAADRSPGLKDSLVEPKGVYWHTRTHMRTIDPVDYSLLSRGIEVNDEHSTIIESQSSNSSSETTAYAHWRELLRKWPGNSKSRPESKENNSIWFDQKEYIDTLK